MVFVVHYSEVALKGKNRPVFVRLLKRNISVSLRGVEPRIKSLQGRLLIDSDLQEVAVRLGKTFGVSWFARATALEPRYEAILERVLSMADGMGPPTTFRLSVRRADKRFQLTSRELAEKLGGEVVRRTGMRVDLRNPSVTLYVDILKEMAIVYTEKVRGAGGLPVGSSGRVLHLFSGGIDSPVAAWLLMKRGCEPVYLHFYLAQSVDQVLESKVIRIVRKLSEWGGRSTTLLLPFADYQIATVGAPPGSEPSLFRYFMRMAAESIAARFNAIAISTGDSLSQAASQTLWNINAIDRGCEYPVLRPLLSYDKQEIVDLAKRIGTYQDSLEDYKDCCAIVTRHPKTRVNRDLILESAERFSFKTLVSETVAKGTILTYNPWTGETRTAPLTENTSNQALSDQLPTVSSVPAAVPSQPVRTS